MNYRLRILPVALAAAVLASSTSNATAANPKGRMAVAGQHEIRATIIAAMADGKLTERERDAILGKAERLLAPEELPKVEQALNHLSARCKTPLPAATPTRADRSDVDAKSAGRQSDKTEPASRQESTASAERNSTKTVSFDLPAASDDSPKTSEDAGSPFQEEPVVEEFDDGSVALMEDATVLYEDGRILLDGLYGICVNGWDRITFAATVDSFKGPLDLDNANGNFGLQFAVNGAVPVLEQLGIGVQAGTSAVLADFHGTQFTGSTIRSQNFTTVGLFQRNPRRAPRLNWGFAFDWLFDDYYSDFRMTQWRVKLGYELSPFSELGLRACIPDDGDSAQLRHEREVDGVTTITYSDERFKPVSQGILYYQRCWQNGTNTTAWIGIAEEPGEFIFGADARIPFNSRMSFVGNFNYVQPSADGVMGQDQEMWNVSMGIELSLGRKGSNFCRTDRFTPFFPLANNGTFAIRRF